MVRRVKFPLDMGNDIMVRAIEELKENYNAEKVTEYFLNGKLLTWLKDRYYDEEAEMVEELSKMFDKEKAAKKLPEIFGIEIKEAVDIEELEIRREKLEKLRAITSDDEILDNVDSVAFSQEDLGDLLDDGADVIYLCGDKFRIPLSVKNVKYIGVNNPAVSIGGKGETDLEGCGISFEKCELSEEIKENITFFQKKSECKIKFYNPAQTSTSSKNNVVLAAQYADETLYIYFRQLILSGSTTSTVMNYQVFLSHENNGKMPTITPFIDNSISKGSAYREALVWGKSLYKELASKTTIYARGNSAFKIYKIQLLEALENLPSKLKKRDGIVDITDSETIAAIDKAVELFVAYNNLNPDDNNPGDDIIDYDPDEEPYD